MLDQSINLYQDRFKEKKILLSANHMLIITALTLLGLFGSGIWINQQHQQASAENAQLQAQKLRTTEQLENTKKRLERLLADSDIDQQLNRVSHDISVRKKMIDFVANNQFGSGEGFSDSLGRLSEIRIQNVWLDAISLADDFVKLSGSALSAEKVPEYFNSFRNKKLFNGREFDIFELDRKKERSWKIDFIIASRTSVKDD